MSYATQAVVLHHADYRDNDRMLTLLSPGKGRVDALARGCRKPKSPLLPCSEVFAFGEYELFTSGGRACVTACSLTDTFYPLRMDYERLKHASYAVNVARELCQPDEPAPQLFTLLLRTLNRLCYTALDARAVTCAYLLHACAVSGFKPRLEHCAICGKRVDASDIRLLDDETGGVIGVCCASSISRGQALSPAQARWLRGVLAVGIEKTACPPQDAPLDAMRCYMDGRLGFSVRGGKEL